MKNIDSKCVLISNKVCNILSLVCRPIKYFWKCISTCFQRPYSLMFCINFLILILPALLVLITLIQFHTIIRNYKLLFPYYYILSMIGLNYYFSFILYDAYQEHYIRHDLKPKYSVPTFLKHLLEYFRLHIELCIVAIFIIFEAITSFIVLHYYTNDTSIDNDYPILNQVLLYSLYSNIIFAIEHIVIYAMVFLILLCTINNSCICLVCCSKHNQYLVKEVHQTKLTVFIQFFLHLLYVFGLFDFKKVFGEQEEESIAQNEELPKE